MAWVYIYEYAWKKGVGEGSNVESYVPAFGLVTLSVGGPHIACLTVWTDFTVLITAKILNLDKIYILA